MRGFQLPVICAVLLALAPHAQCADAEPGKGPLTAAEREQCQAQLNEYNEGVPIYNAKLDEIKALEAEIIALRDELDKETAAVDRRDRAAMEALNARILKSNELVERHGQMNAAIKAMADDRRQRVEQFRETCDNRPPATAPRSTPATASQAQPSDAACNSATGVKDVQRRIEATFAELRVDEKQRQAEVDRVAQARAKAQSWSKERQSQVWLQLLTSPKVMAFEREKQPYKEELMRVIGSKPKNGREECLLVQRIAATLPAIKAINARQYAAMADEMRVAK